MTTGKHLIVVTYDGGATTNDPIIYIDGVSSAVTESSTPVGTYGAEANIDISLGAYSGGTKSHDGKTFLDLMYNRILTPDEVLDIYNSRGASYPRNGLVFCPMLYGAKGLSDFSGTLAAGNTILDKCSGAYGVPTGNPIAVPETFLMIK
jgi:hypothetical protein